MNSGFAVYIRQCLFDISMALLLMMLMMLMIYAVYASGINVSEVFAIAIDFRNPKIIYIAMPKGLYKSTNGGTSWFFQNDILDDISPLVLDPDNPSTIYSTGRGGLYDIVIKSNNGGKNWKFFDNGVWMETSVENNYEL